LEESGVSLPNMRKETLEDAAGLHPILDDYLDFKKYEKLAQMSEIYEKSNPVTGRIHTLFNQIVDTGRYSSSKPNLQNIPARTDEGQRFRKLFIAPKGRVFNVADFSAIELAIIGVFSADQTLLKAINDDLDLHCFTMSHILQCDYEVVLEGKKAKDDEKKIDLDKFIYLAAAREKFDVEFELPELKKVKDLAQWTNKLRDYFKTLTYGTAYQLSAFNLARKFHCTFEVAERFIDSFFSVYKSVKSFIERESDLGVEQGYTTTALGRRRSYRVPRPPSREDAEDAALQQLKEDERSLESVEDEEWYDLVSQQKKRLYREYKQRIGSIRRKAGNHKIQGTSADITKRSMVLYELYAKESGKFDNSEGIILTVHDELIAEVKKKNAKLSAKLLAKSMMDAAHEYLGDDVLINVLPVTSLFWSKG
jgi:DNA polymerase I-like protein with 3'-5' exonuclease and polymerase domains